MGSGVFQEFSEFSLEFIGGCFIGMLGSTHAKTLLVLPTLPQNPLSFETFAPSYTLEFLIVWNGNKFAKGC